MKTPNLIIVLLCTSMGIVSCAKEDLSPRNETTTNPFNKHRDESNTLKDSPMADAAISPCGPGFVFSISFVGIPISGPFPYEILNAGTNTIVDSGTISDGESTHSVLSACTDYDIKFWGGSNSLIYTMYTLTSDGCNGMFVC